ncbi:MAG: DNA polymerase I, partial [Candidatus Omnitrophica bacterium]|nr:DNA polymerase I [Candidatus Omnitrophota bacterium]
VDNIPGVTGIGEKTARKLLEQFGSLDALYQRLGEVGSDALRRRLEAGRAQAELSRELARINAQAPLHTDLNALQLREPDWPALRSLFRELEFKRLLQAVQEEHPAAQSPEQMEAVRIVGSQEFVKAVQGARAAACAIGCWEIGSAASGLFADVEPGILLVAFDTEKRAWATIIGRDAREIGRTLVSWLEDPGAPKLAHNAKAAARLLGRAGILLGGVVGDTMVAGYLVNPVRSTQTLGDLMDEYLQESCPQPPPLACVASTDALAPFGRWVRCVARLHERLLAELDSRQAGALYRELEVPLIEVLARMESRGVALDTAHLQRLQGSMGVRLQQLGGQLHQMAGGEFNLNSPKQLAGVLFERLQLPVLKRTKTGPSTDSEVLRQLAEQHPLPRLLLEYRELSKLVSTYVEALPKLLDPATGRLHTTFNQTATATGRLSSSEPNLQNIPIKTELGRSIRKAFVAGLPDGLLVAGDYSQIELRILAHVSGDPHLLDAFRQGRDIHRFTASLIYGLPEAEVQPEQRNAMKAVNFGILYGMSARGLSRELGVSFEEAQAFIDAYFQRYARVRAYLDEQIAQAKRDGYVQTLLGRRRYLPELSSPDPVIRQFGERAAINAPIQGTAADLIKRAMIRVDAALREQRLESRMVLQVHDELVFEAPRRELPALAALAKGIMEGALALDVPLVVTMKAGPNWLELSPVP